MCSSQNTTVFAHLYKCLSLCKVNPTRGGHLWPMDTGRPQARISPVFSGGSGSDNPRLAWPVLTLALGGLPPYPSPLGSRSWAISFPHPNLPSQPGPPHGRACSKSPDFSRKHLTTGAGITQAKDPGDCVSSRDLGAEPGDRRRGSAGPQPAHTPQASSPERGGPGLRQAGGPIAVCLRPRVTEPQGWRPSPRGAR